MLHMQSTRTVFTDPADTLANTVDRIIDTILAKSTNNRLFYLANEGCPILEHIIVKMILRSYAEHRIYDILHLMYSR